MKLGVVHISSSRRDVTTGSHTVSALYVPEVLKPALISLFPTSAACGGRRGGRRRHPPSARSGKRKGGSGGTGPAGAGGAATPSPSPDPAGGEAQQRRRGGRRGGSSSVRWQEGRWQAAAPRFRHIRRLPSTVAQR
uniref:Uncharacterized protein n=1 Tax=Oryza sativa subsp. japonica TaxID=39947 RepID=Q6YSI8_ORYSJ|nr:hypothetical protein [Oryza sativa Japonica Group]BAD32053.1 hypothetical protein [Oryza sativa Japonica Group]